MTDLNTILTLEGKILQKRRKKLNRLLEKEGLYFGQPKILKFLMATGGCDQNTLAKELECSKASITCSLNRLEKNGLIIREASKEDLRRNIIKLTSLGEEKLASADEILKNTLTGQFEGFSDKELDIMFSLYNKMLNNLNDSEV